MADVVLQGLNDVMKNLNNEIKKIKDRSLKGMIFAGIEIRRTMEKTPPKIPVDMGNLRSSWFLITSTGEAPEGLSASFEGEESSKLATTHKSTIAAMKGVLSAIKEPAIIIGFTANYAIVVHEKTGVTYGRDGAGAKFLENAVLNSKTRVLEIIAKEAKIK